MASKSSFSGSSACDGCSKAASDGDVLISTRHGDLPEGIFPREGKAYQQGPNGYSATTRSIVMGGLINCYSSRWQQTRTARWSTIGKIELAILCWMHKSAAERHLIRFVLLRCWK